MRIALISDTHGRLDRRVPALFAGADEILHAGDIGPESILAELGAIAPVHAVRGNCDHGETGRCPEFVVRRHGGHTLLVTHIVDGPQAARWTFECGARIIVHGHTHRYRCVEMNGALYINPGSAGAPRFGLPPSVALLELDGEVPRCTILSLDGEPLA